MPTLKVNVIEATNLFGADLDGNSDPYCCLKIGDGNQFSCLEKTRKIKNTKNPSWKEVFTLNVNNPQTESLYIEVFNKEGLGKDNSLGYSSLPLHDLTRGYEKQVWLQLEGGTQSTNIIGAIASHLGKKKDKTNQGKVFLGVTALDFGFEPSTLPPGMQQGQQGQQGMQQGMQPELQGQHGQQGMQNQPNIGMQQGQQGIQQPVPQPGMQQGMQPGMQSGQSSIPQQGQQYSGQQGMQGQQGLQPGQQGYQHEQSYSHQPGMQSNIPQSGQSHQHEQSYSNQPGMQSGQSSIPQQGQQYSGQQGMQPGGQQGYQQPMQQQGMQSNQPGMQSHQPGMQSSSTQRSSSRDD